MGCFLDVAEKLCGGSDPNALLDVQAAESVWLCCCPEPYAEGCTFSEMDHECRGAVANALGPVLLEDVTRDMLTSALQRARGELHLVGGANCSVLSEEHPHAECGASSAGAGTLSRVDFFCELVTWQWENLGDGDSAEFASTGCPFIAQNVAQDGEARKGHSFGGDSLLLLALYIPLTDILHAAQVDHNVLAILQTMETQNWEDAWQLYEGSHTGDNVFNPYSGRHLLSLCAPLASEAAVEPISQYYASYGGAAYTHDATYAHHVVSSALQGTGRFAHATASYRSGVVIAGLPELCLWMWVVREMASALETCRADSTGFIHAHTHWDRAWSYIAGSIVGEDGDELGTLLWTRANRACVNFSTCGDLGDDVQGTAAVNWDLVDLFQRGASHLRGRHCDDAETAKELIVSKMMVPLIQNALAGAYEGGTAAPFSIGVAASDSSTLGEHLEVVPSRIAEAWVSALSLLPLVERCDDEAGRALETLLYLDSSGSRPNGRDLEGFLNLKAAFEAVYTCLGVRCDDVNGLMDEGGVHYLPYAEPCLDMDAFSDQPEDVEDTTIEPDEPEEFTVLLVIIGVAFICCTACTSAALVWQMKSHNVSSIRHLVSFWFSESEGRSLAMPPSTIGAHDDDFYVQQEMNRVVPRHGGVAGNATAGEAADTFADRAREARLQHPPTSV